jgi:hypothetical protein
MLYLLLKWLHGLVAVGANVTYGIWIARAPATAPRDDAWGSRGFSSDRHCLPDGREAGVMGVKAQQH